MIIDMLVIFIAMCMVVESPLNLEVFGHVMKSSRTQGSRTCYVCEQV